jgi:hypothetical protein
MYLIHHAVRNDVPITFLQRIFAVLPDCFVLKDNSLRLPLHHASQVGADEEVLEYLVAQYSKGLRERDNVGMIPLHYLVGSNCSLRTLQMFERQYPESVREKDREGWLPLHHASRKNFSLEILQFLVNKYPGSLTEATYHGSLPIHCAAYYNRSLAVNKFLTEQNPKSLKDGGTNGMKPIHSAARNNSLEVLTYFINEYPLALYALDSQQRLPIHYGIKNPDALMVVTYLLQLSAEFIKKPDSNGWLPLHCAARSSESVDLLQCLISYYPEALKIQDNQGWLPIFHAAKCNKSFEVIRFLYEQYPEGILLKIADDVFCHELAPVASNQRNFLGLQFMAMDTGETLMYNEVVRIHLCGDRSSGKTTISNMLKEILLESFNVGGLFDKSLELTPALKSANIGTASNSLMNQSNAISSTSNMQQPNSTSSTMSKVKPVNDNCRIITRSSDRFTHYLLFDYGGQADYHVNHSSSLSLPNSMYVLTIPLYDKINKQKFNLDFLLERMFYWLQFFFSSAHSVLGSHCGSKFTPKIPLVFVLNTFAAESKVSQEEILTIKRVLFQEALTKFHFKTYSEFLQLYDVDLNYLNERCDFVLIGDEVMTLDLSVKQNIRKIAESVKKSTLLLHLPRKYQSTLTNPAMLYDSSAPLYLSKSKRSSDINPFYNLVKESKLISYCWDVLSLIDLSLIMVEEDFHLLLTSTIRTFFHKMLNYKDYKIKENLQSVIEEELYHYVLNYFIFVGKITLMKKRRSVLPPLHIDNIVSPSTAENRSIQSDMVQTTSVNAKSEFKDTDSDSMFDENEQLVVGESTDPATFEDNHPHYSEECYRITLSKHQELDALGNLVVTSPHMLVNNVLDLLIDKLIIELRQNKKQLLLSSGELESWFRDLPTSTLPVSVLDLLVSLKVALPVYYDEKKNSQMIRLVHQNDLPSPGSHPDLYWLYQLSSDAIPETLDINYEFTATINNYNHLNGTSISSDIHREITRVFLLTSPKFIFFPAWFYHFFHFIIYSIPDVIHFNIYSDGLLVISRDVGIVIKPFSCPIPMESDHVSTGFSLKIISSVSVNLENKNNYFNDFLWNLLNSFRNFISSKFWNYSFQEYAYHPSFVFPFSTENTLENMELVPIENLERSWLCGAELSKEEYETYFGVHHFGYDEISRNEEYQNYKLVYLMASTSNFGSIWLQYMDSAQTGEKVEYALARILFSSKFLTLFKDTEKNPDAILTLENINEEVKSMLIQFVLDFSRPRGGGEKSGRKIQDLYTNRHYIVSYAILTKIEVSQIIEKSLEIFQLLHSSKQTKKNQFVRKFQDFPAIPILSTTPLGSIMTADQGVSNANVCQEILIPEDEKLRRFKAQPSSSSSSKCGAKGIRIRESSSVHSYSSLQCFRIDFLCPVCGKRVPAGKDAKGLPLTILRQWPDHLLNVFLISIKIFTYLANNKDLAANNHAIPEIAYLIQETVERMLSELEPSFNSSLPSQPSPEILAILNPSVLFQLQKKTFYLLKNHSLKNFQNMKRLKESLQSLLKIPRLNVSTSLVGPGMLGTPQFTASAAVAAEKRRNSAFSSLFTFGSQPINSPLNSVSVHNSAKNSSIITEEDLQNLSSSNSFPSIINELLKFSRDGDPSTFSGGENALVTTMIENALAAVPLNGDDYFAALQGFMTSLNDDYILHSGLMRVENDWGEIAYVCPPAFAPSSVLSSSTQSDTAVLNVDGSTSTDTSKLNLNDYNWNYSYKRDNPNFKSSCADEFLKRGKKCLIYRFQDS